jgi:hypothetical protein
MDARTKAEAAPLETLSETRRRAGRVESQFLEQGLRMVELSLEMAAASHIDGARQHHRETAAWALQQVRRLSSRISSPAERAALVERCDEMGRRLAAEAADAAPQGFDTGG